MVLPAGLEPARPGLDFGFKGRCVYQFRQGSVLSEYPINGLTRKPLVGMQNCSKIKKVFHVKHLRHGKLWITGITWNRQACESAGRGDSPRFGNPWQNCGQLGEWCYLRSMPKAKNPIAEAERSRRFIEKVRELEADSPEALEHTERVLRRIVKPKGGEPKKAG
jgi:hypothetical protein